MPHPIPGVPGWSFNGRLYKTVDGLLTAVCKASGAAEVSMVDAHNQLRAYGADRKTVVATYNVARPKVGQATAVTRA